MAEANHKPAASPEAPRIVFLGLPDSGKSALLGALAQAALTQDKVLGGRVRTQDLESLHKYAYEHSPEPDQPDIAEFSATLEPGEDNHAPAGDVALLDCDGEAAEEFFKQPEEGLAAKQGVGKEVAATDTVVLTVDSADVPQLKQSIALFGQFLKELEEKRSKGVEVTGLPVYLVLTKCDRLAKPTDTTTAWINRVEERKVQVGKFFKDFLARTIPENSKAFGKIDLHLWATALGRPGFADRPASPQEPFGVAELFRQCLQSAGTFRRRRRKSSHMLQAEVAGAVGLVIFLLLLALVFFAIRPDTEYAQVEEDVQTLVPGKDERASVRFKEPLDEKIDKLNALIKRAAFARLPAQRQKAAKEYLEEITAYRDFDRALLTRVPEPRFATSDLDLSKIYDGLKELQRIVPAQYLDLDKLDQSLQQVRDKLSKGGTKKVDLDQIMSKLRVLLAEESYYPSWFDTKATRRYCQYRYDTDVLASTVDEAVNWFAAQTKEGADLDLEAVGLNFELKKIANSKKKTIPAELSQQVESWKERYAKYKKRLNQYKEDEPAQENGIPEDKTHRRLPGSLTLTYATVQSFNRVVTTQIQWAVVKNELEKRNSELRKTFKELQDR